MLQNEFLLFPLRSGPTSWRMPWEIPYYHVYSSSAFYVVNCSASAFLCLALFAFEINITADKHTCPTECKLLDSNTSNQQKQKINTTCHSTKTTSNMFDAGLRTLIYSSMLYACLRTLTILADINITSIEMAQILTRQFRILRWNVGLISQKNARQENFRILNGYWCC